MLTQKNRNTLLCRQCQVPKRLLLALGILLFRFACVHAQGIQDSVFQISTVEVVADKLLKKEEAGKKETQIDSMVMMEKMTLSISDILAENTTVYIKDYGRGALATASFRGTAPTHTQVSWNGININSPMLGMVDFSLIPVHVVDEMSLQHGAASVAQNSGGLGGHISLNNTADWSNRFSGRFIQGIGSFSTFDEFLQLNLGSQKFQSKSRLYHNYSKNDYVLINTHQGNINPETSETNYPKQRNKDADYKKRGIVQEFYVKANDRFFTSAKLWFQDADRSIPNVLSYEGTENSYKKNRQTDQTLKVVLSGNYYGRKTTVRLNSGIDYQQLHYVLTVKNAGIEEPLKPINSGSKMLSNYNKLKLEHQFGKNFSGTFSTDVNYFNITTKDSTTQTGYDQKRLESSFFGGLHATFYQKLSASLELRQDFIPEISTPIICTFGLSYQPFEQHRFVLKSNIARNFHAPTLNDLYWQPGGNPNLKPEKGHTIEGGFHYIFSVFDAAIDLQMTGYYSDINNWILWLPNVKGYWEAQNLRQVHSSGVEWNLKAGKTFNHLKVKLNTTYTYTKTINKNAIGGIDNSQNQQLPFIPRHSGNALIGLAYRNVYVNYQYSFYGKRSLLSSNYQSLSDEDGDFPFYRLYAHHLNALSLGCSWDLWRLKMNTELKIQNLFDETYRNIINRIMPGRNYSVLLRIGLK